MRKGTYFWIALTAMAITFGSLMVFVGPQQSGWNHYRHGGWHHHHHYYEHDDVDINSREKN